MFAIWEMIWYNNSKKFSTDKIEEVRYGRAFYDAEANL